MKIEKVVAIIVLLCLSNCNIPLASAANHKLVDNGYYEQQHKQVNDVYLHSFAYDVFGLDANQTQTLLSIVYQNPLLDGKAVYDARVMLDINPDDVVPEEIEGGNGLRGKKEMQESQMQQNNLESNYFKLYPNPNNGKMQLDYALLNNENAELIISDIAGRLISKYKLNNNANSLQISEAALKNGVYFYQIIVNSEIVVNNKLVIIK